MLPKPERIRISWYSPGFFVAKKRNLVCSSVLPSRLHQPSHDVMAVPWGLLGTNSEIAMVSYPLVNKKLMFTRGEWWYPTLIHWWYSICIAIMLGWTWKPPPPGSSFSSVLAIFRHTCQTLGDRRVAQTYGGFHTWMIPSINGWFKKWMII